MNAIGILNGKQKDHNVRVLTLLFDKGPLTAYQMALLIGDPKPLALHATLNKRTRSLERKGYLHKIDRQWFLAFKGMIAALLVQSEPKMWNDKWNGIFLKNAKVINKIAPILPDDLTSEIRGNLKVFDNWVEFSKVIKQLLDKGVINLDLIDNETLCLLINSNIVAKHGFSLAMP